MKLRRYFLYAAIAMMMGQAAQAQTAKTIREEYANAIKGAETITAFGPDLFGESVNLKDGVTSFSATDLSAKTNSGLPMMVGRTLGINARDVDEYVNKPADGELFGNWKLDVPMIHGTFDERTGWVVNSAAPNMRCSSGTVPPAVKSAFTGWDIDYYPEQYWHGNEVSIPGKGSGPLLVLPGDRTRPNDGQNYYWTTKDHWRVSCVPTLKNGPGEGFKVSLPDGTKYTFDWLSSRKVAALKDKQCKTAYYNDFGAVNWWYTVYVRQVVPNPDPSGPPFLTVWYRHRVDGGSLSGGSQQVNFCQEQIVVNRREYFLHATKVEDRFGNTVIYDYDPANPRRLRSITSSDGNTITLSYGTHGKISAVTHNGRAWQYQYTGTDGAALAAVVQPDSSRWTFQYGDLFTLLHHDNQKILWADCEPYVPGQATAAVTIGHPSGATGVFNFRAMMHGTERVPGGCYQPDPDKPLHAVLSDIVMVYKTASLTSKQVSGPGVPAQTWNYNYFPNWSWNPTGYSDDCSWAGAVCDSTVKTEVTAPDGTITRSTFGNDYWRSAGQLLKVETVSNGAVVQTVNNTYLTTAAGQAFPDIAGTDPNPRNNRFITEKNRPLGVTTTVRDGDQFTRNVLAFDYYVRPQREMRNSSLGYHKETVVDYHDNLNLWVLGQVRRQYVPSTSINGLWSPNSVVAAETEYNAQAMPWKTYQFGKLQQILSYTAQGNLNTVTDGNGNTVFLGDYYRGIPRLIGFPATPESPSGATQTASVDPNGWITSITNEVSAKTCYGYDSMGRINSIVYPSETQNDACDTSRWSPVSLGFQQIQIDEHGLPPGHWRMHRYEGNKHINTYFDAYWRPVLEEQLDASNIGGTLSQTVKRYDNMGRLSFTSYPQRGVGSYLDVNQGTRNAYDALGRVVRVEQDSELSTLTTTTEYLNGLRTRVTNPRGLSTITAFQAWDEPNYEFPITSVQPEGKIVAIERHPQFGWALRMTQRSADDSVSQSRRYVYDGNAQLCKTIEPETGATVMGYDNAGNLSWSAAGLDRNTYGDIYTCNHTEAWSSDRRVSRTYDTRNRMATLAFPDTRGNQNWTYTPDSLPATVSVINHFNNAAPVSTTYTYNKRRMLVSEALTQPNWYTWTLGYGYDAIGNQNSLSYPTGLVVDFAPNALGQATKAGTFASNAQYYPNGALKQFTYGNGVVYTMEQTARQLPFKTISSGVVHYQYGYDANGNVDHIYDLTDGPEYSPRSRWMTYDGLDRLTSVGAGMFGGDHWHRFTFDALDNIKSWKLAGVKDYADYVYEAQTNRLTTIRNSLGAAVQNFEYDAQGNLQAKNNQGFDFDYGNRLRGAAGKEYYRYDASGRRVMTWKPDGATVLWQYGHAGQMLFSWEGPTNEKTHEYVYLAGSLVATVDHNWPSNSIIATKYHHTDALGSPVAVTNTSGQVIERNEYEPYGAVIGKPTFSGVGYTGHIMDGATGLTYMQQRYYDQSVGRFLSVDPVTADVKTGGNFNRYKYASNSPYRFVDPDGRQEKDKGIVERYFHMGVNEARNGTLDYPLLIAGGADFAIGYLEGAQGTAVLIVAVFTPVPDEAIVFVKTADGFIRATDGVLAMMSAIDHKERLSVLGEAGELAKRYLGAEHAPEVGELIYGLETWSGRLKSLRGEGPLGEQLNSILESLPSQVREAIERARKPIMPPKPPDPPPPPKSH